MLKAINSFLCVSGKTYIIFSSIVVLLAPAHASIKQLPSPYFANFKISFWYGDGSNVRDWIHVHDHNVGVDLILKKGRDGEIYNLGGRSEKTNLEVVKTILKRLGKPESLITFVTDRPGHDLRYAIDSSKSEEELGWKLSYDFDKGMEETINWYINNEDWIKDIKSGKYKEAYSKKLVK